MPVVPDKLSLEEARSLLKEPLNAYDVIVGMNYETLDIDCINMLDFQLLGICGDNQYGRLDFVTYLIEELQARGQEQSVRLTIFDDETQELLRLKHCAGYYETNPEQIAGYLREMYSGQKGTGQTGVEEPLNLIVLNDERVYERISAEEELMSLCRSCMGENVGKRVSFLLTKVPNRNLQKMDCPFLRLLREGNNLMIFDQLQELQIFEPASKMLSKYQKPLQKNEMYLKCGEYFAKYKVPLNGETK